jgi:hypothetical protein
MSDEPILDALGHAEREGQEIPARWRALTEGRATPDELAALEREAAAGGEARVFWERFRPLDASQERALASQLARRVQNDARLRRRRAAVAGAFVLATAAAVLLAWLTIPAALPRYQLEATAADQQVRSALPAADQKSNSQPAADQRIRSSDPAAGGSRTQPAASAITEHHRGSALSLTLRPDRRVDAEIAADAYVLRDGKVSTWDAPLLVSGTGAVRIDGTISELLPKISGDVTLLFIVRRERERALTPDQALAAFEKNDPRILSHAIRVRAD